MLYLYKLLKYGGLAQVRVQLMFDFKSDHSETHPTPHPQVQQSDYHRISCVPWCRWRVCPRREQSWIWLVLECVTVHPLWWFAVTIWYQTNVCAPAQRTRTRQLSVRFTTMLYLWIIKYAVYAFNSCSFNYKLDHSDLIYNQTNMCVQRTRTRQLRARFTTTL